jgi:tetratricopeptide (TPR) repeat protein
MPVDLTPTEIFCSYTHKDEPWLHKIETHLSLLRRQGLLSLWHDRLIAPGIDWTQAIDTHLETASVILLLVSADFFASDYCYGVEMKRALARQEAGEALVIPILLRPTDWKSAPFAHLQALPTDAKPITEWSQEDTALADVAAGIRRALEDLPLLVASAPRTALPHIWNIPYPRNLFFTGREDELKSLHAQLQDHSSAAIGQTQAISGLGGIGKTSLAVEYAYRYYAEYTAILWMLADDLESLNTSYIEIARLLDLPEKEVKDQAIIVRAVKDWFRTHQRYLLIIDNADNPDVFSPFMPHVPGGHILITTRSTAVRRLNIASPLVLETLTPEQGALFLLHRVGLLATDASLVEASSEYQVQAQSISQELGGLPLALEQAGAYIEETGISLATYLQTYRQHRSQLLKQHQPFTYPNPVATTWVISFNKVEQNNVIAADLLRFCAFLAPDAIPETIVTEGADALGPVLSSIAADTYLLDQASGALRAYSLIKRDPHEHTLTVHRLVQAVLRDSLDLTQQRTWAERVIAAMNKAISEPSLMRRQEWQLYLPQVYACSQLIDEYDLVSKETGWLLNQVGTMFRHYSRYVEAEKMYERALRIQERVLGSEHPDTVTTLDNLATIAGIQRKYEEALHMYERALHIREQVLGPEHPDTAITVNGLALLYCDWRRYEESQQMYERALHIREQVLGPEHPDTATTLDNLAMLYRIWGKYEQSEPLFKRALLIREHSFGPDHPTTSSTLNNLAVLYRLQGKYEQAIPLFERAMRIREQTLGLAHPTTATAISNLAYLYRLQGEYEQSLQMYERALHIRGQVYGADHPKTTITCLNMGQLYRELTAYEQAEELIQRALTTHEHALGTEHPKVADILEEYASLLHDLGRDEEAERIEVRVQAIRLKYLGKRINERNG